MVHSETNQNQNSNLSGEQRSSEVLKILVASGDPLVCIGLLSLLSTEKELRIVAQVANSCQRVFSLAQEFIPDMLLLDVSTPTQSSLIDLVICLHKQHPMLKILVLTLGGCTRNLIVGGVVGHVLKSEAPQVLTQAIRAVIQGHTWFSQALLEQLVKTTPPELILTEREQYILNMIARGWSNAQIAAQLNLAEQTVRNYICRIYVKLGVHSRAEAVVWVKEHNIQ